MNIQMKANFCFSSPSWIHLCESEFIRD